MPSALNNIVDIELLIEGSRSELFQKLISQTPPGPCHRSPGEEGSLQLRTPVCQTLTPGNDFPAKSADVDRQQPHIQVDESSYVVQSSYLSGNRSERIFKVIHKASEHYFYAFKFEDYLICPAFLASFFKVTDYACLGVSTNGSHYCYIFLKSEIDDPLSDILNESSRFRGQYSFKVPSGEKVLALNVKNKNLKCVIAVDELKAFQDEVVEYRENPSDKIQRSKSDPSYWIVPQEVKKKLKAIHLSLFSTKFDHGPVIVHKDSKSYLEIEGLMLKRGKSEEEAFTIPVLKNAYNTTIYKREDYVVDHL